MLERKITFGKPFSSAATELPVPVVSYPTTIEYSEENSDRKTLGPDGVVTEIFGPSDVYPFDGGFSFSRTTVDGKLHAWTCHLPGVLDFTSRKALSNFFRPIDSPVIKEAFMRELDRSIPVCVIDSFEGISTNQDVEGYGEDVDCETHGEDEGIEISFSPKQLIDPFSVLKNYDHIRNGLLRGRPTIRTFGENDPRIERVEELLERLGDIEMTFFSMPQEDYPGQIMLELNNIIGKGAWPEATARKYMIATLTVNPEENPELWYSK